VARLEQADRAAAQHPRRRRTVRRQGAVHRRPYPRDPPVALGELGQDDNRPQLLTVQDGPDAEDVGDVANRLVRYAWDDEWQADDALDRGRELCVDLGVSAIRCAWDPDQGNVTGRLATGADGSPLGPEMNAALTEQGALPDGRFPVTGR
jgi:hypothetical protein